MKFDKDIEYINKDIEHIKAHHLILDSIIGVQDTLIDILKRLNKFENKLTSLKVHKTSNKMCNEMKQQVDATIVRKINKNELSKTYISLKKEEYSELTDLINAYKLRKASPVQVAGDDTVAGRYSINYGGSYNRVAPNYI